MKKWTILIHSFVFFTTHYTNLRVRRKSISKSDSSNLKNVRTLLYRIRKKIPASHPHFGYSQLMVVLNAPCVVHAKKMCWTMRRK